MQEGAGRIRSRKASIPDPSHFDAVEGVPSCIGVRRSRWSLCEEAQRGKACKMVGGRPIVDPGSARHARPGLAALQRAAANSGRALLLEPRP